MSCTPSASTWRLFRAIGRAAPSSGERFDGRRARLAPLYDIVSVGVYDNVDRDMAMAIGDRFDPDGVIEADWLDFSHDCGISYTELIRVQRMLATRVPECACNVAALARTEGWHRPVIDRIVRLCEVRARLMMPQD